MAKFIADGGVELNHNNNKKFETTSTGVTVSEYLVQKHLHQLCLLALLRLPSHQLQK